MPGKLDRKWQRRLGSAGDSSPAAAPAAAPAAFPAAFAASDARLAGPAPPALARIAGYRVLRRLASNVRADLYLAHSAEETENGEHTVAVKVFRPEADADSIEREIAVLGRAAPGGLATLIDVSTLPDGRIALVLERLSGGTLGAVLRARGSIDPGEAVTILAPVVAALADLHQQGFAHRTLSQATITLSGAGRPVVTGLGGIRRLPEFGEVLESGSRFDCIREDYARLTVLLRSVFDYLDPETTLARRAELVAASFEMAITAVPFRPCLDDLEHRLFAWSSAAPVRLGAPDAGPGVVTALTPTVGLRGSDAATAGAAAGNAAAVDAAAADAAGLRQLVTDRPAAASRGTPWWGGFALPNELAGLMVRALERNPVDLARRLVRNRLVGEYPERPRGRRAPVLVAVCLAAAASVLGLTLIPQGDASNSGTSDGQKAPGSPGPGATVTPAAIEPGDRAAIAGDDPALAASALLRVRAGCLAAASVVCLDSVDQAGSTALAMDGYTARLLQQGARTSVDPDYSTYAAAVAERTGNSALVTLTPAPTPAGDATGTGAGSQPASLLVIKGEAGWRLREIFDQ
jgi:hypothetical protein